MIDSWLNYQVKPPKATFTVVRVSENQNIDDSIKKELQKEILSEYRDIDFLKFQYKTSPKQDLIDYLENKVFPPIQNDIFHIWQGDFGEILTSLIVSYFRKLKVPIKKMRLKFNKDRSVFCTDMIAHNTDEKITDIYYYEIKTREKMSRKENVKSLYSYVTIHAHNSLLRDKESSTEGIADFLSRYCFDNNEFNDSEKYGDIVKNPGSYKRHFEIFFIGEKL